MYRGGLERFKKAQSLEPFSVTAAKSGTTDTVVKAASTVSQNHQGSGTKVPSEPPAPAAPASSGNQLGGGQSTWQPPDWAVEPRLGVYYLEVVKDGEMIDRINLDRRRHIFGRQVQTCDFVLDHQSVSRQHAAVVPHKNGSIYVIDFGSVHGTFVANERLTKDNPVELEVGQSLRFAASTRTYILRKNSAALFTPTLPADISLPSPPDPNDEDAVVAYNTVLNRYGIKKSDLPSASKELTGSVSSSSGSTQSLERPAKRSRKGRVSFRDQAGGELFEVVGISDGADVETEPGPIGVKEGSLVGKYESLVQVTVIPKGKEQASLKDHQSQGIIVTDKLQQAINKVRNVSKGVRIYDDLYGDGLAGKVNSSWAYRSDAEKPESDNPVSSSVDDSDDLFGDS